MSKFIPRRFNGRKGVNLLFPLIKHKKRTHTSQTYLIPLKEKNSYLYDVKVFLQFLEIFIKLGNYFRTLKTS